MHRLEISGIEGRDICEVSGGQLQRASICRAMINNPGFESMAAGSWPLKTDNTEQVSRPN